MSNFFFFLLLLSDIFFFLLWEWVKFFFSKNFHGPPWKSNGAPLISNVWLLFFSVCSDYMGMENGDIPDANIRASTSFSEKFPAKNGRLFGAWPSMGPWSVEGTVSDPWIQADIGYQTYVSGVVTQGDGGYGSNPNWVTTLKVSTFAFNTNGTEEFCHRWQWWSQGKMLYSTCL